METSTAREMPEVPDMSFAQWKETQDCRVSSHRYFYFYSMYYYYYRIYASMALPNQGQRSAAAPTMGGSSRRSESEFPTREQTPHDVRRSAQPEQRVQDEGMYVTAASPKSRLFAELLDFLLIYLLKDVVYSIVGIEGPELILEQLDNSLRDGNSAANVVIVRNFDQVIKYTALYRLMVMIYETLFLAYGLRGFGGATIGKRLVGLSVIHCRESTMIDREMRKMRVLPGGNMGFMRSFLRSVIKVTVLFVAYPVMIGILFVDNGQTVYDQYSHSIVVETRRMPHPGAGVGGRLDERDDNPVHHHHH